jgi:hypothetical protein
MKDTVVFARFRIEHPEQLTITQVGSSLGAVYDTVPGGTISCPPRCVHTYPRGTVVTLVAVPGPGARFVGWRNRDCPGTGSCTVMMNVDLTVAPHFALPVAPHVHRHREWQGWRISWAATPPERSRIY